MSKTGNGVIDLQAYRKARQPAPKSPRMRRRKNDAGDSSWRPMTDDERRLAKRLVGKMLIRIFNAPPRGEESARAISFAFNMAVKAITEMHAQVTERQADWLWGLAVRYGLATEENGNAG
jgi:hypothetical protein